MKRNWTENQEKAIGAHGGRVLVSAAAGSGKTAVLTERVKRLLCDKSDPLGVDELLVVTFTNAAASEMRERIAKALREEIRAGGGNSGTLRRQLLLLPNADISTIDAFCGKLVKEQFHLAGVSPDYRLMDKNDSDNMMSEIAGGVIDALYEEKSESFLALSKMLLSERDDSRLEKVMLSLYRYSRSYPAAKQWLCSLKEAFDPEKNAGFEGWTEVLFGEVKLLCAFYIPLLSCCIDKLEADEKLKNAYAPSFEATRENFGELAKAAANREWDKMVFLIGDTPVRRSLSAVRGVNEELRNFCKTALDSCEGAIKKLWEHTLPDSSQHRLDLELQYPLVKALVDAVLAFSDALDAKKAEENTYTFDDILHKAIALLVTEQADGTFRRTAFAEALSERYREILIDEYQDTNEAQNILFEAISRNCENIYCVGDVKQSIYRFRLASPELFMRLKNTLPAYTAAAPNGKILLEKNFRSRESVTSTVNFAFSRLMSKAAGEIDYNDEEALVPAAQYPKEDENPFSELHILRADSAVLSDDMTKAEADYVADYIRNALDSGFKIYDAAAGAMREARAGDFCILLRSVVNRAEIYGKALELWGIPASVAKDGDIQNSREIAFLLSLIRVVNNPGDTVSLIAVMLSPFFGFTPDELSEIRLVERKGEWYANLNRYAKTHPKAEAFLKKLQLYRNVAAASGMEEFVQFLCDDTAVREVYSCLAGAKNRLDYLESLLSAVKRFTDSGRKSLNALVRYLDTMVVNGNLKNTVTGSAGTESVSIMTIHKSKGLEFPVVLLAGLGRDFNRQDSVGFLTVSREAGIGMKIRDDSRVTQYHTLSSAAGERAIFSGEMSEELRVLYVAMTRAREHLVFVGTLKDGSPVKRIRCACEVAATRADGTIPAYAVQKASSMAEWLASAFAFHPDCADLRAVLQLPTLKTHPANYRMKCVIRDIRSLSSAASTAQNVCAGAQEEPMILPDAALLAELRERAAFVYPYEALSGVLAKRTASSAENNEAKRLRFAKTKPQFLTKKMTGALRGTAVHKFLELCDFAEAKRDLSAELERLCTAGRMTPEEIQAVEAENPADFFTQPVVSRLLQSEDVKKEMTFSALFPAGELYLDLPAAAAKEKIVVQGKVDCVFREGNQLILIDYKTDRVTSQEELTEAYRGQIAAYRRALAECTGLPVAESYLYSFQLKKMIPV